MPEPTFDLPAAHRWFAIEFNNRAWDLVEAPIRTADEADEMLRLAHAAATHWSAVGKPINELRARLLLALAHAVVGEGPAAVRFAKQCADLGAALDSELTPFDRASIAVSQACAQRSIGAVEIARRWELSARDISKQFDDADDQVVIERLLALETPHGRAS